MNSVQAADRRSRERRQAEYQARHDSMEFRKWMVANRAAFILLKRTTPEVWAA